jgi:hypothetical protein
MRLWQEISQDDANWLKPMLLNRTTESGLLQRCKRKRDSNSLFAKFMTFVAPQSATGRRYTPPNIADSSRITTQYQQGTSPRPVSDNVPSSVQTTNPGACSGIYTIMGQPANSGDPRILFGVKGPNPALKLEQIPIKEMTTDSNFYEELQKRYRLNRGRFRYWFSFWRLGFCEVVKV